jgi:hypothetical protein
VNLDRRAEDDEVRVPAMCRVGRDALGDAVGPRSGRRPVDGCELGAGNGAYDLCVELAHTRRALDPLTLLDVRRRPQDRIPGLVPARAGRRPAKPHGAACEVRMEVERVDRDEEVAGVHRVGGRRSCARRKDRDDHEPGDRDHAEHPAGDRGEGAAWVARRGPAVAAAVEREQEREGGHEQEVRREGGDEVSQEAPDIKACRREAALGDQEHGEPGADQDTGDGRTPQQPDQTADRGEVDHPLAPGELPETVQVVMECAPVEREVLADVEVDRGDRDRQRRQADPCPVGGEEREVAEAAVLPDRHAQQGRERRGSGEEKPPVPTRDEQREHRRGGEEEVRRLDRERVPDCEPGREGVEITAGGRQSQREVGADQEDDHRREVTAVAQPHRRRERHVDVAGVVVGEEEVDDENGEHHPQTADQVRVGAPAEHPHDPVDAEERDRCEHENVQGDDRREPGDQARAGDRRDRRGHQREAVGDRGEWEPAVRKLPGGRVVPVRVAAVVVDGPVVGRDPRDLRHHPPVSEDEHPQDDPRRDSLDEHLRATEKAPGPVRGAAERGGRACCGIVNGCGHLRDVERH